MDIDYSRVEESGSVKGKSPLLFAARGSILIPKRLANLSEADKHRFTSCYRVHNFKYGSNHADSQVGSLIGHSQGVKEQTTCQGGRFT